MKSSLCFLVVLLVVLTVAAAAAGASGHHAAAFSRAPVVLAPDPGIDMDICDRQEEEPVDDPVEFTVGGYTLVNKNDTNSNDQSDLDDDDGGVEGEVDLMRLVIHRPVPDDLYDHVTLCKVGGDVKVWTDEEKGEGNELEFDGGEADIDVDDIPQDGLELWVEARSAADSFRSIRFHVQYGEVAMDQVTGTGIAAERMTLGGSATALGICSVGSVYVPTKWGGTLELTGSGFLQVYYKDGSTLDADAIAIARGSASYESYLVAEGNTPLEYAVPKNKQGCYYVFRSYLTPQNITNAFEQSKTVTKSPWVCPWYPIADEQEPNLYDAGGCLDKYDTAYGSASRDVERGNLRYGGGHYLAKSTLREDDAEQTLGYDIDNADNDDDPWTGWAADYEWDFWDSNPDPPAPPDGFWGTDGDETDVIDVSTWGHCDQATAAIILEDEPTGNFNAPNSVVFTPADKKGLLVALYHKFPMASATSADPLPHEWHSRLEEWILDADTMFGCDTYNSGSGKDTVWNYPIYAIQKTSYRQEPGQDDEKVVEVTCEVKYWTGAAGTLYYLYNVTYDGAGVASSSDAADWQDHPSAPANKKRPDCVWMPGLQTQVDEFWDGELSYTTIRTIVPAP